MKQIDKLAAQWIESKHPQSPRPLVPRTFIQTPGLYDKGKEFEAFEAGFQKAREMAHQRFEQAFERNEVVQDTLDAIATLGETEVKE